MNRATLTALRELVAKSDAQMLMPVDRVSRVEVERLQYDLANAVRAILAREGAINMSNKRDVPLSFDDIFGLDALVRGDNGQWIKMSIYRGLVGYRAYMAV